MTLQRRVLGYLAVAAIASCALTVAVGVVLVRHRLSAQRMTVLETQANTVAGVGGAPGALAPGQHVYRVGSGGARLVRPAVAAGVLAEIPGTGAAQGTITVRGRGLLYAARPTATGRIVLVRPAAFTFGEWRPFLASLILAGAGGALLALVLSYVLARRLTRPIGELGAATGRLASGERGVAVPVHGEDELAELGRAFNEMAGELERARESQRTFLESVSHELKTPLTSIRGYAEALEDGAVRPSEGAPVIAAEADRLERLVADLLDLARLGRSGFSVAREPLDLSAVAEQAVARHLPRAREMSVDLSLATTDGRPRAVGDAGRVLQVSSNLIENALRLTPAGGKVTVLVGEGRISVKDTGPGLADEDLPRAFERFYLHRRYSGERGVGSGLGLAIVKELVDAMGGSVEASATPGGGAELIVHLPTSG
ncbi:MAG: HAMP domain-containing histidine kinase [Solirubrobacterales bacterium]|nr:HAMP domain-containing histidine kinase [Solirubrobacterales bacterium]